MTSSFMSLHACLIKTAARGACGAAPLDSLIHDCLCTNYVRVDLDSFHRGNIEGRCCTLIPPGPLLLFMFLLVCALHAGFFSKMWRTIIESESLSKTSFTGTTS